MRKKLSQQKGMTLIEMLCAVVLVVVMSALVATGIGLAVNTMDNYVTLSEARVLCSTLATKVYDTMHDELTGYSFTTDAEAFEAAEDSSLALFVARDRAEGNVYYNATDGRGELFLQCGDGQPVKLLPSNTYPANAEAGIEITGVKGNYQVKIKIYNAQGTVISHSYFDVILTEPSATE